MRGVQVRDSQPGTFERMSPADTTRSDAKEREDGSREVGSAHTGKERWCKSFRTALSSWLRTQYQYYIVIRDAFTQMQAYLTDEVDRS